MSYFDGLESEPDTDVRSVVVDPARAEVTAGDIRLSTGATVLWLTGHVPTHARLIAQCDAVSRALQRVVRLVAADGHVLRTFYPRRRRATLPGVGGTRPPQRKEAL